MGAAQGHGGNFGGREAGYGRKQRGEGGDVKPVEDRMEREDRLVPFCEGGEGEGGMLCVADGSCFCRGPCRPSLSAHLIKKTTHGVLRRETVLPRLSRSRSRRSSAPPGV